VADRDFTLDDYMAMMANVRGLGPLARVIAGMPGLPEQLRRMGQDASDVERQMDRPRGVYDAMCPDGRRRPDGPDGRRRRRIARGAGVPAGDVDQFIRQFEITRRMMRQAGR
jgi:signal recognition particle subunit SRP54